MNYTLLDIVQKVLGSMDADEVNSIFDSVESRQVTEIVEQVYDELVSTSSLPEHFTLFNLEPSGISEPVVLSKPSSIDEMLWFKYNKRSEDDDKDFWGPVQYLDHMEFLNLVQSLDSSSADVGTFDVIFESSRTPLYYTNNQAPKFWTSFDDHTIICDSYDAAVDANLQASKTSCYGRRNLTFTQDDLWIPEIDRQQMVILVNESKALAWAEMKQSIHAKAEKKVREGKIRLQKDKFDTRPPRTALDRVPNYGRK